MLDYQVIEYLVKRQWSLDIVDNEWALITDLTDGKLNPNIAGIGHIPCMNKGKVTSSENERSFWVAVMHVKDEKCFLCKTPMPDAPKFIIHLRTL